MAAKFGTSGLRGLSTELVGSVSALYATAFAQYLLKNNLAKPGDAICIARDFRDSSPEIATTVMAAIARAGLKAIDCGEIPTPALALYAIARGEAAIMITGSHIPADRNGIKFYRPDGEIAKPDEVAITALADELKDDDTANLVEVGTAEDHSKAAIELFEKRNEAVLLPGALKGMKIGVYQHSTVARDMLMDVVSFYGAKAFALGRSNSFIPVDTEAVSEDTQLKLKDWAAEHTLDAVISSDGDGDRPLLADENGVPLRGDLLGLLTARFVDAKTIATPVTSNSGIEAAGGFEVVRTKVGSPFVIAAMDEARTAGKDSILGFEANGGLMLASDFEVGGRAIAALPTRDSFLPILAVLATAANGKKSLSAIAEEISLPIAMADRLENFATEKSQALMSYLRASESNLETFLRPIGKPASHSDIDGLRVTLEDARVIHFRPSGNAPEMRCYVEAKSADAAQALLKQGLSIIANWKPA
ncbi:phosphomannomutase [Agrobacterium sp. ES01]|uniref:phosphomannomutase n=1 Tax=Agrobacterium sp. ES01 TaxID=3420714 RepID=UPI003D09D5AE